MKRKIIIVAVTVFLIALIIDLIDMIRTAFQDMASDPEIYTKTVKADYLKLFKDGQHFDVINTREGKFRQPVTNLSFNHNFIVQIQKIDSNQTESLKKLIILTSDFSPITPGVGYFTERSDSPMHVRRKAGAPGIFSTIHFNLLGDNNQTLADNDTVACYHSELKNFSIKYSESDSDEIYAEPIDRTTRSVEIAFVKKQKNIFQIFFYSKERMFKPGLLFDLLNK